MADTWTNDAHNEQDSNMWSFRADTPPDKNAPPKSTFLTPKRPQTGKTASPEPQKNTPRIVTPPSTAVTARMKSPLQGMRNRLGNLKNEAKKKSWQAIKKAAHHSWEFAKDTPENAMDSIRDFCYFPGHYTKEFVVKIALPAFGYLAAALATIGTFVIGSAFFLDSLTPSIPTGANDTTSESAFTSIQEQFPVVYDAAAVEKSVHFAEEVAKFHRGMSIKAKDLRKQIPDLKQKWATCAEDAEKRNNPFLSCSAAFHTQYIFTGELVKLLNYMDTQNAHLNSLSQESSDITQYSSSTIRGAYYDADIIYNAFKGLVGGQEYQKEKRSFLLRNYTITVTEGRGENAKTYQVHAGDFFVSKLTALTAALETLSPTENRF